MVLMLKDVLAALGAGLGIFAQGPVQGPVQMSMTPHEELVVGSGQAIGNGQKLTVHLLVSDSTGREYTNTKKRGLPYSFMYEESSTDALNQWLMGMRVGGQRRLTLSADASAPFSQIVPANTPLVVFVTVLRASGR